MELKASLNGSFDPDLLWGSFVPSRDVDRVYGSAKAFNSSKINADRYNSRLPICRPDMSFLRVLSDLRFTREEADTTDENEFRSRVLGNLQAGFAPYIDIEKVFFHPRERWQTIP